MCEVLPVESFRSHSRSNSSDSNKCCCCWWCYSQNHFPGVPGLAQWEAMRKPNWSGGLGVGPSPLSPVCGCFFPGPIISDDADSCLVVAGGPWKMQRFGLRKDCVQTPTLPFLLGGLKKLHRLPNPLFLHPSMSWSWGSLTHRVDLGLKWVPVQCPAWHLACGRGWLASPPCTFYSKVNSLAAGNPVVYTDPGYLVNLSALTPLRNRRSIF